jgi:predicted DNA-binding transcriptional regulator AlpA
LYRSKFASSTPKQKDFGRHPSALVNFSAGHGAAIRGMKKASHCLWLVPRDNDSPRGALPMQVYDVFWSVATSAFAKLIERMATLWAERLMTTKATDALMTEAEVCAYLQIDRVTLYRWRRDNPKFPKAIKLGGRLIRWKRAKIEAWLDAQ